MGQPPGSRSPFRCLMVLLAATVSAGAVVAELVPDLVELASVLRSRALADEPFDELLVKVCELTVVGCTLWLWAVTALVAGCAAQGRTGKRRGVPDVLRRMVLTACGLALVGGLGTPAHAEDPGRGGEAGPALVKGLPLPDRATTAMHVSQVFARAVSLHERARAGREPAVVVVRPGDTLWQLARRDLRTGADASAVAERVREIYDANRAVIGADPDLIQPGQRLQIPNR